MSAERLVAIIPAAGKPTNKILTHTNLPDTMLPINGKPVIGYILDDLLQRNITEAIIILNPEDEYTEKYVTKKFGSKLQLIVVSNPEYHRGIGYSLYIASELFSGETGALVYLGDTIYKGPLSFKDNFLVTTREYETSEKWCFVETIEDGRYRYVNKPKEYRGDGQVLSGLYFFKDGHVFRDALRNSLSDQQVLEIHHVLDRYPQPFNLVAAEQCYDCGNIENYYRAKIDFLRTRSFNTITYNDLYGTITKSGEKREKLEDEVNWYKNTPETLKIFSPRLVDYQIDREHVEYSLEYYGYQSLADYFIFNHFDIKVWVLIIERLFEILSLFKKYTTNLPFSCFDEIYRKKTLSRLETLRINPWWETNLTASTISINGNPYRGWPYYAVKLGAVTKELYDRSPMSFIHGDPCLSNILFDPHNRIMKFIDPRGSFGARSVYGDHHYDIAKLRHSFVSRYDFIVSDLFGIEESSNGFTFTTFHEPEHELIGNLFSQALVTHGYDADVIKWIEALLFLSMIPLHSDAPHRQKAMFITGIRLLNELPV